MPAFLAYTLVCFGSVFSIVDPFAALPIFLALVGEQSKEVQHRTAFRASLTVFAVLASFGLAGTLIFTFFSITIPAFKIAGGILLFGVALEMMRARQSATRTTKEERDEAESKEQVGLIPLGIPLLSGPGAIATVTVLVGRAKNVEQKIGVHIAVLATALITFLVLRSAPVVARVLGRTGINLIGRIMGLIHAASAMQFIIDGAREAFPKLVG